MTIRPGEAARIVAGKDVSSKWRALMPAARKATPRLVAKGKAEIPQYGRPTPPPPGGRSVSGCGRSIGQR
jgi:hypothetical protein